MAKNEKDPISGRDFIEALCKSMGVDPSRVMKVELTVKYEDAMVIVHFDHIAERNVLKVLRQEGVTEEEDRYDQMPPVQR